MASDNGEFSTKIAFQCVRRKKEEMNWEKSIWLRGMPFKICFFQWRIWKRRVATDDILKRMKINLASRYYCCEKYEQENMSHLF